MARLRVEERVSRGIELMDRRGPEGWRSKLDLDALNIDDPCECVIGQAHGGAWGVWWRVIGSNTYPEIGRHARFAPAFGMALYESEANAGPLNAEWRRQLQGADA